MKTMYKTIRQGENSLQYTILPQHDDFKNVDGKLRPATAARSGGGGRKKKSLMAFIGLFFVCSIITGAILVPLMVSVEFMASPSAWFHKSTNASSSSSSSSTSSSVSTTVVSQKNVAGGAQFSASKLQKLKTVSKIIKFDYPAAATTVPKTTTASIPITTTADVPSVKPSILVTTTETTTTIDQQQLLQTYPPVSRQRVNTIDAVVNKATTVVGQTTRNFDDEDVGEDNLLLRPPLQQSTIVSTEKATPVLVQTISTTVASMPTIDATNEQQIPGKPAVSSYKEEVSLSPVVDRPKEAKNWLKSHWPIVDPSTYFQWTVRYLL